jgi:CHAD domain-containing protein
MMADCPDLRPPLRARFAHFHTHLAKIQQESSAPHVHSFRIVCRELLACYPLFKPVKSSRHWRKPLRKALNELNRLRDLQQMREQHAELAEALEPLIEKARARWQRYAPGLHEPRFCHALQKSERWLENPACCPADLLANAWRLWQHNLRRVKRRLQKASAEDLSSLHRLRIRYKALRYLLELLQKSGVSLPGDHSVLKPWQDMLGAVEDFRSMSLLVMELGLPASLQEELLQKAQAQAQLCLARRAELAELLVRLDNQVTQQISGQAP